MAHGHRESAAVDLVTDDYLVTMSSKPIGVAQFKARLSEYLRAVGRGRDLVIYDRDQPIARVVPYAAATGRLVVREPLHGYATLGEIPIPEPAALDVDTVELLLEDRRRER